MQCLHFLDHLVYYKECNVQHSQCTQRQRRALQKSSCFMNDVSSDGNNYDHRFEN